MIILGLTGSIGMGKSTAAQMLRDMGVPVHDSDMAIHHALDAGGAAVDDVAALFPEALMITANGDGEQRSIDRKIMGNIVFHDRDRKKQLEDILHPLARASQAVFLEDNRKQHKPVVALDIPLLYETGAEKRVDKVIVVTCPAFIQRRRVLSRPRMDRKKFDSILASQTPDAEKRRRADFIVQTGLGRCYSRYRLKRILRKIMAH